jgi:hypothetical protein
MFGVLYQLISRSSSRHRFMLFLGLKISATVRDKGSRFYNEECSKVVVALQHGEAAYRHTNGNMRRWRLCAGVATSEKSPRRDLPSRGDILLLRTFLQKKFLYTTSARLLSLSLLAAGALTSDCVVPVGASVDLLKKRLGLAALIAKNSTEVRTTCLLRSIKVKLLTQAMFSELLTTTVGKRHRAHITSSGLSGSLACRIGKRA